MSLITSIIPVFIPHVGCPHNCVFCDQKSIAGSVCAPTPEQVSKQVEQALEKPHKSPPQVAFYGGSFTAIPVDDQMAYLDAVKKWVENGELSGVRVSTRPDFIDNAIVARLWDNGVRTIELGIQSFDDGVLKASGRGHSSRAGIDAVKCIKKHGMGLILQLMAGLPGDTRETALASAYQAAELYPDGVRIYPVAVIENTALAKLYKSGKYKPLSVDEAIEWAADMLEVFIDEDIPVIRIGLNPSESLEPVVLAGAYHPALGELVRSRVYLRRARESIKEINPQPGADIILKCGKRYVSAVCGQKALNRITLEEEFKAASLRVREAELKEWQVEASVIKKT